MPPIAPPSLQTTLDLLLEEVRATRVELRSMGSRLASVEARQVSQPSGAQHDVLASRLEWHEASCRETNERLLAVDEDFERRLRKLEEAPKRRPIELGAAAGAGGLVAGVVELMRYLATFVQ